MKISKGIVAAEVVGPVRGGREGTSREGRGREEREKKQRPASFLGVCGYDVFFEGAPIYGGFLIRQDKDDKFWYGWDKWSLIIGISEEGLKRGIDTEVRGGRGGRLSEGKKNPSWTNGDEEGDGDRFMGGPVGERETSVRNSRRKETEENRTLAKISLRTKSG